MDEVLLLWVMYSTTNWPLSPLDVLMDQNILEQHNIRIQAFDIKACTMQYWEKSCTNPQ